MSPLEQNHLPGMTGHHGGQGGGHHTHGHLDIEGFEQIYYVGVKCKESNIYLHLKLFAPTTPTPTRESRDTTTSGLPMALKFGMEALINQTKSTS